MCIAREITFFDASAGAVVTLRSGTKLTDMNITQMRMSRVVAGAFIDSRSSEARVISSINSEIKENAISNIHNLADNFMDSSKGVTQSDIDAIGDTTEQLIDELASKKDILINIADIKMYDDYTYHHSLSVAIMAIAIGLEMGYDRRKLDELGVAGLLHDIGKVSVPIEIINKKGRLTDEEYSVVRLHPIYAAEHLRARKLVSEDCCLGIIGHHERWDGSGYPMKLKGEEIHEYARILAVADVYDALTSNRPYRIPAPPNEAIEFIMGGMYSHFDENVVKAFLRKVAPFPTGSKVKLSNGETATVIKNNNDQPLRPLVVTEAGIEYDLGDHKKNTNIVITGLCDEETARLIHG
ncbi:HD-GYP domain-containing protein [Huintestinicola sp.]|uniref:HD-GYP domain-containing protein n=1 Tax=Huintestinicola sp. TaxID=2981661 RepID=UPI003D7E77B6